MKLFLLLFLMPFAFLIGKLTEPDVTPEDFHFELTVNSTSEDIARFSLLITGVTLNEDGEQKPFRVQHDNLKTPYKLNLDRGKYTAVIEAKKGDVFSKVQGFKNGEEKGYTSGNQKVATMHFEYLGKQ